MNKKIDIQSQLIRIELNWIVIPRIEIRLDQEVPRDISRHLLIQSDSIYTLYCQKYWVTPF